MTTRLFPIQELPKDDVRGSRCCGAPLEWIVTGGWRCSVCRKEIKS